MPDSFGIPGTLGFRILDSGFRDSGFRGLGFGFGFNLNFHPKKYVKWWPDTAFQTGRRDPGHSISAGLKGGALCCPKGPCTPNSIDFGPKVPIYMGGCQN